MFAKSLGSIVQEKTAKPVLDETSNRYLNQAAVS